MSTVTRKKTSSKYYSTVEEFYLQQSNQEIIYRPTEKINTLIVDNFPALGRLVAMRFLEWAQKNEGWTISLPTGKTPEHFIKWVTHFINKWDKPDTRKLLEKNGVDPGKKPDLKSFHFIQIDEFYPINSYQQNSFYYYVNKFYIKGFGLDPEKALLIDPNKIGLNAGEELDDIWPDNIVNLNLRFQHPRTILERKQKRVLDAVDQFCTEYETKIRSLGGIGFFLGGIGPDGHIGFNVKGSDHYSTTRLTPTNYETQAAAAGDLGGIEISRHRLVITIGLQTIVNNPETTAIIIAAGEAKAKVIKDAIQSEKCNAVPASVLQDLQHSCFYITKGAAKLLTERRYHALQQNAEISRQDKFQIITDLALEKGKRIVDLTKADMKTIRSSKLLLDKAGDRFTDLLKEIETDFVSFINLALQIPKNQTILHTAPHHDDIALGYLPYLVRLMRESTNTHYFNYLTSGFNAVTNGYMLRQIQTAQNFLQAPAFRRLIAENYFDPSNIQFRNRDVFQYLDGLAADNTYAMNEGHARRLLRNLVEIFEDDSLDNLLNRIRELISYFETQYPGKKDLPYIQQLKGMTREWEADIKWGYFGFTCESVIHSRLGFYKGEIFTEEPTIDRDVQPILNNLRKIKPTVVTVAFDPEGSGPDTHYKVRAILDHVFLNSFGSQKEASFPSYEYDGPFSGLAQKIQVEQYQFMKTLLGRDFFYQNPDSRIRSTRGFVYLKVMDLQEFYERTSELKKMTENV